MGFYRERLVKAVRKARRCCACGQAIEVGQSALDCAGHYDGDFWSDTYHPDCRAAECQLNDLHGAEEWMMLDEIEWDDWPWLLEDHPAVAARMGITNARYDEAVESERRCREAWMSREKPA